MHNDSIIYSHFIFFWIFFHLICSDWSKPTCGRVVMVMKLIFITVSCFVHQQQSSAAENHGEGGRLSGETPNTPTATRTKHIKHQINPAVKGAVQQFVSHRRRKMKVRAMSISSSQQGAGSPEEDGPVLEQSNNQYWSLHHDVGGKSSFIVGFYLNLSCFSLFFFFLLQNDF